MTDAEVSLGLASAPTDTRSVIALYERDRLVTLRQVLSPGALAALREEADILVAQDPKRDYDLADNG